MSDFDFNVDDDNWNIDVYCRAILMSRISDLP
jgi:hypothetical protein